MRREAPEPLVQSTALGRGSRAEPRTAATSGGSSGAVAGSDREWFRVVKRVACLHHVRGLKQNEVADTLGLSQSRVSRLLDTAVAVGIVRTWVRVPPGLQLELEQALDETYGRREARVFDIPGPEDESRLLGDLGLMLAGYLEESPLEGDVIGFTSWSRTLRETVRALNPPRPGCTPITWSRCSGTSALRQYSTKPRR